MYPYTVLVVTRMPPSVDPTPATKFCRISPSPAPNVPPSLVMLSEKKQSEMEAYELATVAPVIALVTVLVPDAIKSQRLIIKSEVAAPAMMIDDHLHRDLTEDKLDEILNRYE